MDSGCWLCEENQVDCEDNGEREYDVDAIWGPAEASESAEDPGDEGTDFGRVRHGQVTVMSCTVSSKTSV